MRVARLQRVIARFYKQALRAARLTQPQMEALTILLSTAGPVSPAALAARLMLERSTISRNLAPMQIRQGRRGRDLGHGTSDVRDDHRPADPPANNASGPRGPKACRRDTGWPAGLVLLDGGRASKQVAAIGSSPSRTAAGPGQSSACAL